MRAIRSESTAHLFDVALDATHPFDTTAVAPGQHSPYTRRVSIARIEEVGYAGYSPQELATLERDGMFEGQSENDKGTKDRVADPDTNLAYLAAVRARHNRSVQT
jgi:hypothetical protein